MDGISREKRSEIMRAVKSRNTRPELILRRSLHRKGYRYKLHVSALPGKPDLAFPARKKVIFVNGCFWHGHEGCSRARPPKENSVFWEKKIALNVVRDQRNHARLRAAGWEIFVVWQCQMKRDGTFLTDVISFLEGE